VRFTWMKAILAALLVSCSVLAVAGDKEWSIGNIVPPNASATALCQAFSTKYEYDYLGIGPVSRPEPKLDLYMAKCLFRLPRAFWKWFHKQGDMNDLKGPNGQVSKDVADEYHKEWLEKGKPKPDNKGGGGGIDDILNLVPPLILPPGFEEACEVHPTMFGCPKPKLPMC